MNFRSMGDLNRDLALWSDRLPRDLDLIVGIPRSGLLAGVMLALHMQLPLTDVRGLTEGRLLGGGARLGEVDETSYIASARRILVIDDSVYTGRAIDEARETLAGADIAAPIEFGAVYASPMSISKVDHYYQVIPQPRLFEWNIMHHPCLAESCMDIDGVLCRDPTEAENDDGPLYEAFIRDVPVRLVPSVEVGYLVTARLERYREQTEAWLAAAGIRYRNLIMHPAATGRERRLAGNHGGHKAAAYKRVGGPLFIESSLSQAITIANEARGPVYCTDERRMIYPGTSAHGMLRDSPRRIDSLRWRLRHEVGLKVKAARRLVKRLTSR